MVMTTLFNHPFDDFLTEADLLFKNAFKSNSVFDPVLNSKINQYNPCVETIFFMTWGRENGDTQKLHSKSSSLHLYRYG